MTRTRPTRTLSNGALEKLGDRIVPSGITSLPVATQEAFVTTRAGNDLGSVFTQYEQYQAAGAKGSFTPSQAGKIFFMGNSVGIDVTFHGGNYDTLTSQLESIGMKVTGTAPALGMVEGYLPISELPVLASNGYATSINPVYIPVQSSTTTDTTGSDEAAVTNKGGQDLGAIYTQYVNYEQAGGQGSFTTTESSKIFISGTSVGVDIRISGADFNTQVTQLESLGFQVTATAPTYSLVEGYMPISELPTVANDPYVVGLTPVYKPALN